MRPGPVDGSSWACLYAAPRQPLPPSVPVAHLCRVLTLAHATPEGQRGEQDEPDYSGDAQIWFAALCLSHNGLLRTSSCGSAVGAGSTHWSVLSAGGHG